MKHTPAKGLRSENLAHNGETRPIRGHTDPPSPTKSPGGGTQYVNRGQPRGKLYYIKFNKLLADLRSHNKRKKFKEKKT